MSNYRLDERKRMKELINKKLAFNKKVVLNCVNDLDNTTPQQKLSIIEQITKQKVLPEPSLIQEIQKEQIINDTTKPFTKSLELVNNNKNKIKELKAELAIKEIDAKIMSRREQLSLMSENINTILIHSVAHQKNFGVLSLLSNIAKVYDDLISYHLFDFLSTADFTKLYAINKVLLNKSLLKNKKTFHNLPFQAKDIYNDLKRYQRYFEENIPNVNEIASLLIKEAKKPIFDIPNISLEEIRDRLNEETSLTKSEANELMKAYIQKVSSTDMNNDLTTLKDIVFTGDALKSSMYDILDKDIDLYTRFKRDFRSAIAIYKNKFPKTPRESPRESPIPVPELTYPESGILGETIPESPSTPPKQSTSPSKIPKPSTPPKQSTGSGIQTLFNKVKKYMTIS